MIDNYDDYYEENYSNEPVVPYVYSSGLKYRTKKELIELIECLYKVARFQRDKLRDINNNCWNTRESFYTMQENWKKSYDDLDEWEQQLYWSGYLEKADEFHYGYFGGII